jgi:hypothetical protein
MTDQGKKALRQALQIIAGQPRIELINIEADISPYFASKLGHDGNLVNAAIEVVMEAIQRSGTRD